MESLDKRVSRILGQMKGVQKMVKERRDPVETLQQIAAVKKAIDGFTKEIVNLYIHENLPEDEVKKIQKVLDRAINL